LVAKQINMKKVVLVWFISAFCLYGSVIGLDYFVPQPIISYDELKKISQPITYVYTVDNLAPVSVLSIPEGTIESLNVELEFKIDKFKLYSNVFSTADVNRGVRMELSEQPSEYDDVGESKYLLSIVYNKIKGLTGTVLTKNLELGRTYKLSLKMFHDGCIQAKLNQGELITDCGVFAKLSNFVLGQGFSEERFFYGSVTATNVSYSLLPKISKRDIPWSIRITNSRFIRYSIFVIASIFNFMTFIYIIKKLILEREEHAQV
jgi:hypothetical protein